MCHVITCACFQAIDLIRVDPSLVPFVPSDGYIELTFGLPNFPTEFVKPSTIRDTQVLIEMPFNTKNVSTISFISCHYNALYVCNVYCIAGKFGREKVW